jgi:N-acyl-D-aspartate/D-glutamate deacylase
MTLPGRVVTTIFGGVVTVRDGQITDPDQVAHGKAMV